MHFYIKLLSLPNCAINLDVTSLPQDRHATVTFEGIRVRVPISSDIYLSALLLLVLLPIFKQGIRTEEMQKAFSVSTPP